METLNFEKAMAGLPALPDAEKIDAIWKAALEKMHGVRIMVLDDDPTGVQTVHDIPVFTDWSEEAIGAAMAGDYPLSFILTNSRAFSAQETEKAHEEMAQRIAAAAKKGGYGYLIMSRGDSTLRGHYPLETDVLRRTMERAGDKVDGEIICPYFAEGGRFTIDSVHYVKMGQELVPAGETEFARDATFGYRASDLRDWVEEKTAGRIQAAQVERLTLAEIRSGDVEGIAEKLAGLNGRALVADGVCEGDMRLLSAAIALAVASGKRFIFRTAAGLVKALGGIESRPLLGREELRLPGGKGGLILVGSHVQKTTAQLNSLLELEGVVQREFDITKPLEQESRAARAWAEEALQKGQVAVIYTSRKRAQVPGGPEEQLKFSVAVSAAVTDIVKQLEVTPGFLIAKGGITSSDIGIKGLGVKRAMVAGQAAPGIPVWRCGEESRFPGLSYVIFPGNVGDEDTLRNMVAGLR
ncbi:four-carbon acid sugar kinase family protein [Luoshenia tenuis]